LGTLTQIAAYRPCSLSLRVIQESNRIAIVSVLNLSLKSFDVYRGHPKKPASAGFIVFEFYSLGILQ
jgi:hypothetical protein